MMTDYATTIRNLESVIPAERIGYFFFETLFRPETMARMSAFLGIGPISARLDARVNAGADAGTRPDAALARRAHETFAHVYDMVHDKFGDAMPDAWRRPIAAPARALTAGE